MPYIVTSGLSLSQKQSSMVTMKTESSDVANFTFSQGKWVLNIALYFNSLSSYGQIVVRMKYKAGSE
jgi:hypothetical protein